MSAGKRHPDVLKVGMYGDMPQFQKISQHMRPLSAPRKRTVKTKEKIQKIRPQSAATRSSSSASSNYRLTDSITQESMKPALVALALSFQKTASNSSLRSSSNSASPKRRPQSATHRSRRNKNKNSSNSRRPQSAKVRKRKVHFENDTI